MNKKIIAICILLFAVISQAQVFGLEVNGHFTNFHSSNEDLYDSNPKFGFGIGTKLNIPLMKNKLYLVPGLGYQISNNELTYKESLFIPINNVDSIAVNSIIDQQFNYLELPIELQYILGQENPVTLFVHGSTVYFLNYEYNVTSSSNELLVGNNYKVEDNIYNRLNVFYGGGFLLNLSQLFHLDGNVITQLKFSYDTSAMDIIKNDIIYSEDGKYDNSKSGLSRFKFAILLEL